MSSSSKGDSTKRRKTTPKNGKKLPTKVMNNESNENEISEFNEEQEDSYFLDLEDIKEYQVKDEE